VLAFTSWEFLSVSITTGKKLWAVRLDGSEKECTPLVYKDLILFSDYRECPRAIRLEKSDRGLTAKDVWKGDGPTPYMSSPVLEGDLVFGMSARGAGSFFCLDPRTGRTLWEGGRKEVFGYAAVLNARSAVLLLTPRGRLVVVKPTGKEYAPIAEYRVSDRQTWAHPIFLGDRILIRDETSLRSYRIDADPHN
jgi:outer membrane protein assembly factor BamB